MITENASVLMPAATLPLAALAEDRQNWVRLALEEMFL